MIRNKVIKDGVEKRTAGNPKMRELVNYLLETESEGKYFAKSGKLAIEKAAREKEALEKK